MGTKMIQLAEGKDWHSIIDQEDTEVDGVRLATVNPGSMDAGSIGRLESSQHHCLLLR